VPVETIGSTGTTKVSTPKAPAKAEIKNSFTYLNLKEKQLDGLTKPAAQSVKPAAPANPSIAYLQEQAPDEVVQKVKQANEPSGKLAKFRSAFTTNPEDIDKTAAYMQRVK
jgi:hypothetical protein